MTRPVALGFMIAAGIAPLAAAAGPERSPLHGSLVPGRHAVGFSIVQMADPTRPTRPATRADIGSSDRARKLAVHVWYPAAAAVAAGPMTFAEILTSHMAGRPAEELRRREADLRRFVSQFGPVADAKWTELMRAPLLARRDPAPAPGRFPLIVGQLRPVSTCTRDRRTRTTRSAKRWRPRAHAPRRST